MWQPATPTNGSLFFYTLPLKCIPPVIENGLSVIRSGGKQGFGDANQMSVRPAGVLLGWEEGERGVAITGTIERAELRFGHPPGSPSPAPLHAPPPE